MDFHTVRKKCVVCGKPLALKNNRDMERKRFCSRQCIGKANGPSGFKGKKHSAETRQKMRESKAALLKSGWRPVGWRKYGKVALAKGKYKYLGTKREHAIIAKPRDGQCVHHINFDRSDNRPENLMVMDCGEHQRLHATLQKEKAKFREASTGA